MAIGWLTALKVVPWNDVIEAAPLVVNSARKFFSRTQQPAPAAGAEDRPAEAIERLSPLAQLEGRVDQMAANVAQLDERQQASAALIQSLAEQNAQLVEALDLLRKRCAMLAIGVATLTLCGGAALVWFGR